MARQTSGLRCARISNVKNAGAADGVCAWRDRARRSAAALLLLSLCSLDAAAETSPALPGAQMRSSPAITAVDLMAHIKALASAKMEGRRTGEAGGALAEEYVAARFQRLGLEPSGENGGYFQKFSFIKGVALGPKTRLEVARKGEDNQTLREVFKLDREWRPLGYSSIGAAAPGCVVFAGYGLRQGREVGRKSEGWRYDSYAGVKDLKGCWALVWRGAPPKMERRARSALLGLSGIAYKASIASSLGARGLIVADGPGYGYARGLPRLRFGPRMQRQQIPVLAISEAAAWKLMLAGGLNPAKEATLRSEGLAKGRVRPLADVAIGAEIDLIVQRATARNVIGRLRLGGGDAPPILLGAHLDHLGRGGGYASLARADERGMIHYGADDNASGVAAMLETAERFVDARRKGLSAPRDLLFAAWMGEELGLLGSGAYVSWRRAKTGPAAAAEAAYVNLDMIGRLGARLTLSGLNSSPDWKAAIDKANESLDLQIALEPNAYLPTDATSFYLAGAPILSFSTGQHADYHSPRDVPEGINAKGLKKIALLLEGVLRERLLAPSAPRYRWTQATHERAARRSGAVYLGLAPAFSPAPRPGVPLLGVIAGGPAAQAGLTSGDLLIELAGERIATFHDLVRILDRLPPGAPVPVSVLRGEKRVRLSVTPRVRE